jgi:RND family efflux transporter MFP subunit
MTRNLYALMALLAFTSVAYAESPLTTSTATYHELPRQHLLDGIVEATHQGTMSAQTGGQVQELLFDVDDFVKEGEVIIRLKDRKQQAALSQAKAALKEAQAGLDEARKKHRRIKEVFAKKLVSRADMDRANTALKAAAARTDAAKAGLAQAEEQLEYTLIRAPYSGIVTERHVELGEIASPGRKLMSGISLDSLRVTVEVPQSLIPAIRKNQKGSIELPNGIWMPAERLTVFPYAHSGSNTFKVRLELPPKVKGLFPGMFVKSAFVVGTQKELLVPQQAVVYRGEVTGTYVVSPEGKISLRHIRASERIHNGMVPILSGLEEGEKVALDPIAAGVALKKQMAEQPNG